MSFLLLSEEFKTGLAEIDKPHEKICELLNDLRALIKAETDLQIIFNRIDNIISFIVEHQFSEEKLMLDYAYPRYTEHKKEHDGFYKTIRKLVVELKGAANVTSMDLLMVTRGPIGWFFNHTAKLDKDLANFIKARNEVA